MQLGNIVRLRAIDLGSDDVATAIERYVDHHATSTLTGVGGHGQFARLTHGILKRVLNHNRAINFRVASL